MTRNQAALLISLMYPVWEIDVDAETGKPVVGLVNYSVKDFNKWDENWWLLFDLYTPEGAVNYASLKAEHILRRLPKALLAKFIVANWSLSYKRSIVNGCPFGDAEKRLANEAGAWLAEHEKYSKS